MLDAGFSYKLGRGLDLIGLPFIHVFDVPEFEKYRMPTIGHTRVPDEEIAAYCGDRRHVLVAFDKGFHGRYVRTGLLRKADLEVIVMPQVIGVDGQLLRIAECYSSWQQILCRQPYGYRVWTHNTRSRVPQLQRSVT